MISKASHEGCLFFSYQLPSNWLARKAVLLYNSSMALTFPSYRPTTPQSRASDQSEMLSLCTVPVFTKPLSFTQRRHLPSVTLVCVTDRHLDLSRLAMERCSSFFQFGAVKLFTSQPTDCPYVTKIGPIQSLGDYSRFVIKELHKHIDTEHVLIIQWDGYIINPEMWQDEFLKYDYIGAPWMGAPNVPWFGSPSVGNGGFSLRTRKLLQHASAVIPEAQAKLAEDSVICHDFKTELMQLGCTYAPLDLAAKFSMELWPSQSFGFHSYKTPIPPDKRLAKIFYHSGDLGDIIYALPTIKMLGGGILCLHSDITNGMGPRARITEESFNNIMPLLKEQPYLRAVYHGHYHCDYDLNAFRGQFHLPGIDPHRNLVQLVYRAFCIEAPDPQAWLTIANPILGDVVMHRSPRYHDPQFPWQKVLKELKNRRITFIGAREEFEDFRRQFRCPASMTYVACENMLVLAQRIAGAKLFIGNQSSPMAIALGLGVPVWQEVSPEVPNCVLQGRSNVRYGFK